jgi:hypothetical protein
MTGQIVRSDVRFGLDDLPGEIPSPESPDQDLTEKAPGNLKRRSAVELAFKLHSKGFKA